MEQLTSKQISEWFAYDTLEPVGEERAEFGIALLCSVITNLFISKYNKRGTKLSTPSDFIPLWDAERTVESDKKSHQSISEMKKVLQDIARFNQNNPKKPIYRGRNK